jgi:hypothetical protein
MANKTELYSMKKFLISATLALAAFCGSLGAALADQSIIAQITDGRTWDAQPDGGSKMKMTLNPDGTGKMKFGIMSRKIAWTPNGDGICMTGIPGGKNCIVFSPTNKGFTGKTADGKILTLTRS